MSVLKNVKRVLVRATLSTKAISTAIADVSMDTAVESYDPAFPVATGVEVCLAYFINCVENTKLYVVFLYLCLNLFLSVILFITCAFFNYYFFPRF